jgi:hypothetical protein
VADKNHKELIRVIEENSSEWIRKVPAVLGNADGIVEAGQGLVYARLSNGYVVTAINYIAPLIFDLSVMIGQSKSLSGIWQVISVRETFVNPATTNVKYHHEQHEFDSNGNPGPDQTWVNRKALLPLTILVSDGAGFMVRVFGNVTQTAAGVQLIDTQDIDLSSYVPTSGAKYISLECDDDGVVVVQDGTTVGAVELLTETDIPISSPDKYFLGYVMLYESQAELTDEHIRVAFPPGILWRGKADDVLLKRLGITVTRNLQYMQNVIHSTGWISGGEITNNGDGTIAVAAGIGTLRATDSSLDTLFFVDWETDTSISLTDESINWLYIAYNSGEPIALISTTQPTDYNTNIILAKIYRTGTELHINETLRHTIGDHASLMMRSMMETMPFAWVSGAMISEVGTRQFMITAGIWWNGLTRFGTDEFDGATDTFNMYYRDGSGGWTEVTGETAINNTQYDDGDGTLATLTANRYGVHWIYIATDNDVHSVLGQGDYTLAQAQAASAPENIPPELEVDSRLAAKIIIQKSASAFTSLESFIGMGGGTPSGTGITEEEIQDIVGAMLSGNTETGIVVDYQDSDGTIDFIAEVTQAELDAVSASIPNTEAIQDIIGAMFSGNTETGIAATYDDTNGKIDLVAEVPQSELDAHLNDTTDAHDASAISVADAGSYLVATEVEAALQEIATKILPFGVYQHISPLTVDPSFPYAQTIERQITLLKWTQQFYVATTNNSTNYWKFELNRISDGTVIATIQTNASAVNTQLVLSTTSFTNNPVATTALMVYVKCSKVGAPGALYLSGPAVEYKRA